MTETIKYRIVGLWRIWERGTDARDPFTRAPDALVERLAGEFTQEPDDRERDAALSVAEDQLAAQSACLHCEPVASIVVGDYGWTAMLERSAWNEGKSCRHEPGSRDLSRLQIYGWHLESIEKAKGPAWAPARRDPRSFEAVIERARAASEAAGVPEYETFGTEVPYFVRPQDERRLQRKRLPSRDRDGGTL